MNAPEYVFGADRTLDQVPARHRSSRLAVAVLLILIAIATAFGPRLASADEERFEPSSRSGRDQVLELAERHFPPHLVPWVMATARCESGYDLNAHVEGYDRRLRVYYSFWGPLQVDAVTWGLEAADRFGGPLSDPDVSMAMAAWIATNLGTSHWPVCSGGGPLGGGW